MSQLFPTFYKLKNIDTNKISSLKNVFRVALVTSDNNVLNEMVVYGMYSSSPQTRNKSMY